MIKVAKRVTFNALYRSADTIQGKTWTLDAHAKGEETEVASFALWILNKVDGALMIYEDDFEAMKIREIFPDEKFLRLPAKVSPKALAEHLMKVASGTFPSAEIFAITLSQGDDPDACVTITID